jgi:hypothetical protein
MCRPYIDTKFKFKFFIDMKFNKGLSSATIQSTDTQNMKQLKTKSIYIYMYIGSTHAI